ncbi:MAG: ABC transporter permease [Bacteroidota bacterium]
MLKHLFSKKNQVLLNELVRTDFKLRYQGSALGYIWSLLRPLLMFVILYIVFVKLLKLGNGIPHYPVYLLLGIVLWNFFYEMTVLSLGSIVGRGDLIRKINIPRWIIVFSMSLSALINLIINLIVIVVFMLLDNVSLSSSVFFFPLYVIEIYIFSLGISFYLASIYVKFRDVSYIWEVLLQAGFYLTPILYPLSRITKPIFQKLVLLNPIAQAMQGARYSLITHQTITFSSVFNNTYFILIPFTIVLIVVYVGVNTFRKQSKYFAENI